MSLRREVTTPCASPLIPDFAERHGEFYHHCIGVLRLRREPLVLDGFDEAEVREVTDEPMASQYLGNRRDPRVSDNVVSLR